MDGGGCDRKEFSVADFHYFARETSTQVQVKVQSSRILAADLHQKRWLIGEIKSRICSTDRRSELLPRGIFPLDIVGSPCKSRPSDPSEKVFAPAFPKLLAPPSRQGRRHNHKTACKLMQGKDGHRQQYIIIKAKHAQPNDAITIDNNTPPP